MKEELMDKINKMINIGDVTFYRDEYSVIYAGLARDNVNYVVDIFPYYGSDVGAAYRSGRDVKGALIGQGVHASHGMERTHLDGVINTMKLLYLYLK